MATKLTLLSKLIAPIANIPIVYMCSSYLEGDSLSNFSTLLFSSLLIQALTAGASLRFFKVIRLGGWKYSAARRAATIFQTRQLALGALAYIVLRAFFLDGTSTIYEMALEMLLFALATPSVFYQRIYYARINTDLFKVFFFSGVLALALSMYLVLALNMSSAILIYFSLQVFWLHLKLRESIKLRYIFKNSFVFSKNVGPFYVLEIASALYAYVDQFSLSLAIEPELMSGMSFVFRMTAYLVAALSVFSFVVHYNLSGHRQFQAPTTILTRAFFLSLSGSLLIFVVDYVLNYTSIGIDKVDGFSFWAVIYLWTFVQVFSAYTYSIVISHSRVSRVIRALSVTMLASVPLLVLFSMLGHIVLVLIIKSAVLLICIFIHLRFIVQCKNNQS